MQNAIRSVVAVFVLIAIGMALYSRPNSDPAWLTSSARKTVETSMTNFCAELYGGRSCGAIMLTGKSRWIVSVKFDKNVPQIQHIDEIFQKLGWVLVIEENTAIKTHCKGEFAASYEMAKGQIAFVSFEAGNRRCTVDNKH